MATDSTNLPQGETTLDAGIDMTASDLDLTTVQEVANEPKNFVELPKGNTVILLPVQPGQTVRLPTDTADGLLAKIGPEGNLAIVVDGRTIILQGFLKANDQTPIKIVTNDGDDVNVADLIAATDQSLDIQTAAGPASGNQGEGADGSGIYVPFNAGPGLGGILAEGILDPTALRYRLIDDEYKEYTLDEDGRPTNIEITFDILGGIVNEDDLPADEGGDPQLFLVVKDVGNDGKGNDPFDDDTTVDGPKNDQAGSDDTDGVPDADPEPLTTQATVKVTFPAGEVPGTLEVFADELPSDLTSEGGKIVYQEVADPDTKVRTVYGFVDGFGGDGKFDPAADSSDRLVFEIKVLEASSDSVFHIDFTLHDNIDNAAPDADGNKSPDLLGADEQVLDLPVKITAADKDGDPLSTVMHLGVQDDIPFFGEVGFEEGEEGIFVTISNTDASIEHDETDGIDGDADDVDPVDLLPLVPELGPKIIAAGFSLPFESEGATVGTAQTQVMASFGADQASQEQDKPAVGSARNSIFGELEDITDRDGDNTEDGENEQPFELFMMVDSEADGAIATQFKNPGDKDLQTAHLSIEDQPTNATVTWFGSSEQVFLHQIDAQTIVGYILVDEVENGEESLQALDAAPGESKELVFVLHIDDSGVLSFAQFHQLNHNTDGPTPDDHDDTQVGSGQFQILGGDGTPLIHVRISDFDGDHATQPVNLVIQDDGPKFVGVEYDLCQTDSDATPTDVHEHFDDLSGWTVVTDGVAEIVGDIDTSDPQPDPTKQALLVPAGADQADIESFLGLGSGALDGIGDDGEGDNGTEDPTNGSAIKKTFDVNAGDVLTVKFNFLENENDGGEEGDDAPSFQDLAFIAIGDQVIRLSNVGDADVPSSANTGTFSWDEESGYLTFTYTFTQSGPVQIGFGVMNEGDTAVNPGLLIDELKIAPVCEGAIDEDALKGGIEGGPGDGVGGVSVGGNIDFDFGVDRPGLLSIDGLAIADDKGAAIAFDDLETADGNGVEWGSKSGPDGDGWVTWTAIEEGTGDPVFVFKLDTSGSGQGDFVFELKQALSHPFTDDPKDPTDTNTAWEDNLHFNFNVKATDVDGDWTFGNVKISVDDDSPTAECDVDCVTEGKTDGQLNFASGNVVTGDPATAFADDANHLDGNADAPGADRPYTISKLSHDGADYTLIDNGDGTFSAAKDGVLIDGSGDESFDTTTGILSIMTAEGGTFEIVMVSSVQSEVGDYKYTVPADADHDVDHHIGPSVNDSAEFGDVTAWTTAWHNGGIDVVALGGSLLVKAPFPVVEDDPEAPDNGYSGFGVNGGDNDEPEVDTDGNGSASEGLRLNILASEFPGGVNNIELTIGALFDGNQYDSGHQEILEWQAWNGGFLVASGQILGDNDGLVTLDIDTLVPFDHIILKPIDNGVHDNFNNNSDFVLINAEICCPQDKFTEQFEYTLRDADGDEASATLKVDVKDTEPTREHGQPFITAFVVDEDGLPKGVGNTDSPLDDSEDHSAPNAPVDDARHFGTIPFTPGADPTSIELSVLGGPNTGLKTLDNQKVLAAWDPTLKALIGYIEGTDPNDAANQVFKMTILDPLTGEYSFELLQAVKHDNADFIFNNDTENALNTPANFIVVAEIEDKDCDVLYSKVVVSIDDDMPVITPCYEQGDLLVNGSFEDLGKEDGGVLDRGSWGVLSQIPGWTSGAAADPTQAGLEIQADGAVPQIDAKDGEHYAELDSDALNPGDGKPASTNAFIYQDVDTVDGNNYVLSFSYSPRVGEPSTDGIEVWFDGVKVATIDSGKVGEWTDYKFVVEAGEGDLTPDSSRLEFKAVGTSDSLGGFIDDVSLTTCAIVDEDALPNGIEGGPGDDGIIGACFSGSLGVNFGADGGKSIVFNTTGQPNLTSHGNPVKYAWDNATQTLIGYTGTNVPANWVFTVAVQSLDNGGEYKFTLLKPLDHPDTDNIPGNENDHGKGSFEDNLVFDLKFKATDRDDDTVEGKLKINVDDDSPSGELVKIEVDKQGDGALVHDETKGDDGDDDVVGPLAQFGGLEGSEAIVAIGYAKTSVNVDLSGGGGNPNAAYGADGPGTTALSLTGPGGLPFSGTATNLFDTATGEPIFLYTEGGLVVGRVGSGGAADAGGDVSFALSIDNAGNLSVAQYRAIQHPDETNPDDSVTLLAAGGEDAVVHITAKVTDYDGDAITVTVPLDGEECNGAIRFEDDGPTATCDYDCVVEGKNDDVPNSAIGNVVTGANVTIFGSDLNNLDGNPDNPGVDGPYTISKLSHGGTTYYLNDLGGGAFSVTEGAPAPAGTPIDGVTETFDGKTLKIPSAEGGTFEIVMVSPTQAEVGDYKYTVPENAHHDHDKHFGPESLAETRSAAFDTTQEWVDAFQADGVTLTNLGGTGFAIKDIDVVPKTGFGGAEDYRGIGISGGIDGAEVDTHQETMQLQFATPTDNAEVLIGAFFDGAQFDNGFQEIIQWKALAADGVTVIASGQILGSDNGLVTLDVDTNGVDFTYIQLTPLNNGGGNSANNSDFVLVNVETCCPTEKFQEQFDYTLRDGDGDESTATLKIDVKDTHPRPPEGTGTLAFAVDEDGLPGGIGNNDSPNDIPSNSASFAGNIPFIPGADPVTIELSIGNGGDTGLKTLAGQAVLAAWDAESSTLIGYIAGTDPSDLGNQVFKMTVTDHNTGAFTFDLLKPIKHADIDEAGDNTENEPDPSFTVNVQIEDKDCDVAYTDVKISIDDDMPVITHLRADGDGVTIHDETPGVQSSGSDDDQPLASLPSYFKGLVNAGPAIGWAEDGEAGVSLGVDFGADGPASSGSIQYDLSLTSNLGVDSKLDTTAGLSIWLFQEGDIVVGRVGSGATGETPNSGGAVAFAVAIQDDGDLQVAQYLALKHPDTGNHDEDIGIALEALQAKVTASDKDGDSVSKTVDIGNLVRFDDDGPNARNDFDNIQTNDGGATFFADGNVITGASTISPGTGSDIVGADQPGKITGVSGAGGADVDPAGDFVVQGLYGKLTMQEDGDYHYDLDETKIGSIPSGATEQFLYRLADGDGDSDLATLTIKFPEAKIPETEIGVGPNMNGVMKEDVSNAIYFEVDPQQASDTVVHVKITGLIGWNLGVIDGSTVDILGPASDSNITFNPLTGVLEFDVTGAGAGNTITGFFNAIPPEDTDLDQPLAIEATVQDGPITATGTDSTTVVVDAILDEYVNVEGANKSGVENLVAPQSINLGLTAAFQSTGFAGALAGGSDTDASESHAVKLVFSAVLPAGTVVEFNAGFGSVTQDLVGDPTGKTFIVTPNALANLDDLVASIGLNLPAGFDGTISGQIQSASEEANTPPPVIPGNAEITNADNTKNDSADFSVTISPKPDVRIEVGLESQGHCIFEDTPATFVVNAATDSASHLTSVVLSGLSTGFTYDFAGLDTDGAGGNVVVDVSQLALGQVTITFPNGNVENYGGTFVATPPADSDVDFGTLTGTVNAANDVNPLVTNSTDDSDYFETDAVADGKDDANGGDGDGNILSVSISVDDSADGDPTFAANEIGTVKIGATFDDFKDGSEVHTVTIDAPAGFKFLSVDALSLPAGVTVQSLADGEVVLLVDSTDGVAPAGVGSFSDVVINVQNVSAPSGTTVSFTATAKAVETNLSGEECTTDNNEQSVEAKADATTFTNLIPIAYDDKKCGDEAGPQNANIMVILDVSGSMNSPSGVGSLTKLEAAKQATINMLNAYADTGGDVRVMLVWFNSSADREEAWLDVDDAIAAINAIPASGDSASTDYQDAIATAILGFQDTDGRGDPATHPGFVYFLSDGQPNNGGNPNDNPDVDGLPNNGITPATLTDWNNLLESNGNNVEQVYSVGFGAGIPDGASNVHLISVANPDNDAPTDPSGTVLFVDDLNDLSATLAGTVGTLNEGNVLDGSIENDPAAPTPGMGNDPDNVGDGFSHVSFFQYDHPTDNDLDITITWDGVGNVEPGDVSGGENTIINGTKVSFDTEHGRMTFDLSNGDYDFVAGSIDGGDKEEHFTYKITDSNDDQSNPADLTVCIKDVFVDKTPITYDDVASGAEPAPKSVNLLLVFDNSGSMDDPSGIPNTTKLEAAKEAAINMLNGYAATGGDVRVMLVTFNSGASREGQWLNLADAIDAIDDIPQSNNSTNYEAAIATAISGFNDTDGRGDFATHDNFVYFLSDGEPTTGGNSGDNSITDGTLTNWDNLLENPANQIDHVYAVGLGTGIPGGASNPNLIDVARPDGDNNAPNTVILVDDFNDLSATLTGTIGTPIEGNILDGTIENDPDAPGPNTADDQGDGPAHLSHFEYDSADNDLDIKITWDGAGAVVVDGAANGKATSINGKEVSFDTDHGRMTIDFSDGDFKFVPESISGGNKTEVFEYKTTDVDGDVSNESKLSVTIENLPGVVSVGDTTVNEGGNANVQVNLSEAAPVGGVTVNYTFQTKVGNTATGGGTDYNTVTSSIFIAAGATSGLIPVNAVADAFFEGNETYGVVITGVTGGSYTVADDTGLVTITDKTTLDVPLNTHAVEGSGWPGEIGESGELGSGNNNVDGEDGEDGFAGENGNDDISGLGGDDNLDGEGGNDDLFGGADDDRLFGDSGDDELDGGSGDDLLIGGDDFDTYAGGSGNDWIEVDDDDLVPGRSIDGGDGNDVLDISGSDLTGADGITNIEVITMEPGNNSDVLSLSATDVLNMTDGDNTLFVWGDDNDDLALTGGGWSKTASSVSGDDGGTYHVFQNGLATVFVETQVETTTP